MGNKENEWKNRVLQSIRDYQAQLTGGEDPVMKTAKNDSHYIKNSKPTLENPLTPFKAPADGTRYSPSP